MLLVVEGVISVFRRNVTDMTEGPSQLTLSQLSAICAAAAFSIPALSTTVQLITSTTTGIDWLRLRVGYKREVLDTSSISWTALRSRLAVTSS